jgi:hypothetical protein
MKAVAVIVLLLYFISARSWDDYEDMPDPCSQDSWDLKPLNPYGDTVIITDPYARDLNSNGD